MSNLVFKKSFQTLKILLQKGSFSYNKDNNFIKNFSLKNKSRGTEKAFKKL